MSTRETNDKNKISQQRNRKCKKNPNEILGLKDTIIQI